MLLVVIHCMTPSLFQKKNTWNILMARDPTVNIGLHWYAFTTMFSDRVTFTRYIFVLMRLAACCFASQHIWNLFNYLDWGAEGKY